MKRYILNSLILILNSVAVNSHASDGARPQIGGLVRNSDGSIRNMNQDDAIDYCASQGQHLPSAKEFAQESQSMGAAGISETAKEGYYPVKAQNSDGTIDNFYFSFAGYDRPTGDLGSTWVLSSSVKIDDTDGAYWDAGDTGGPVFIHNTLANAGAVRCAAGPSPQTQPVPQIGILAKNTDGSPRNMSQTEAIDYCKSQAQHLPSARELAQLAQSLGAAGISANNLKNGYYPVTAKNADGITDTFSFNIARYKRPQGDLGNYWFLSSSVRTDNPVGSPYGLLGALGAIISVTDDPNTPQPHAVLCFQGR